MRILPFLLLAAFARAKEPIAVKYLDERGAYVEELIFNAPEGATAETFGRSVNDRVAPVPADRDARWALAPTASSDGDVALVLSYSRSFGEFRELLPTRQYYDVVTAQAGEPERIVLPPPPRPTFLQRTAQVVSDNPWKSLLTTAVVTYLALDRTDNGSFDFSVGSSSGGGSPAPPPVPPSSDITSVTSGSVVTSSANGVSFSTRTDGRSSETSIQVTPPLPASETPAK